MIHDLPNKKYAIIYADPPWTYANANPPQGKIPYPTMKLDDIKAMPISNLAEKDCILFMWVTMPMLDEGLQVIKSWGFTYKTCGFTWIKQNPKNGGIFVGLGHWTRGNAELCLLATKGKPKRFNNSIRQVLMSPRGRHSAKPSETRNRIVELMGDLPRLELFARERVEGWDSWGNQVDG